MQGELPSGWEQAIDAFAKGSRRTTRSESRKSSQAAIGAIAQGVPELFGGSADPDRLKQHPVEQCARQIGT